MVMRGLTWATLKKNPSLLPLFAFVGLGVAGATFYTIRVAVRNPEISINKRGNPEPWNEYSQKQYKFYSPNISEDKLRKPAPDY